MKFVALFAVLGAGCSERGFNPLDDSDDTDIGIPEDSGDTSDPPTEECNGLDDDDDGQIDEGFPDLDDDGTKDCMDTTCEVEFDPLDSVPIDPECINVDPIADPWDYDELWVWEHWSTDEGLRNAYSTPLVGAVGPYSQAAVVTVVFTEGDFEGGQVVALDASSGAEFWKSTDTVYATSILAIADVTGDGDDDVVAINHLGHAIAIDHTGANLWESTDWCGSDNVVVADLEGNGSIEVICDRHVFNGATGAVEANLATSFIGVETPAIGDVDNDGTSEIFAGNSLYSADGTELWAGPWSGQSQSGRAIVTYFQNDGDAELELLLMADGVFDIYDHEGNLVHHTANQGTFLGYPCIADLDGDDILDVAFGADMGFKVLHPDGYELWSKATANNSGDASCSTADLNGDGFREVIFADTDTFYVLDGVTGAERIADNGHSSGTANEYPTVVDVDGDGTSEILLASNDFWYGTDPGWTGIRALAHTGEGWRSGGDSWTTYENSLETGFLHSTPESEGAVLPDWFVTIEDLCYSGCEAGARASAAIRIVNNGGSAPNEDLTISLYWETESGSTLIERGYIPAVQPGAALTMTMNDIPITLKQATLSRGRTIPSISKTLSSNAMNPTMRPPGPIIPATEVRCARSNSCRFQRFLKSLGFPTRFFRFRKNEFA